MLSENEALHMVHYAESESGPRRIGISYVTLNYAQVGNLVIPYPDANEEPANPAGTQLSREPQSVGTQKPSPKNLFTGAAPCFQIFRGTPSSGITGIS